MNITERVTVEVVKEVVIGKLCDICNRQVDVKNYFKITIGHYDWGNDNIDSVEYKDACCPACVMKFTEEYIKGAYNNPHNTKYIEVEHQWKL